MHQRPGQPWARPCGRTGATSYLPSLNIPFHSYIQCLPLNIVRSKCEKEANWGLVRSCLKINWFGSKHWEFDFRCQESPILVFDSGWTCQVSFPINAPFFSETLNRHVFDPSYLSVLGLCLVFIPILKSVCTHCALSHVAVRGTNDFFLLFFLLTTKGNS